jgi:two-component system, OmpR family, sensor histidine kinase QseC
VSRASVLPPAPARPLVAGSHWQRSRRWLRRRSLGQRLLLVIALAAPLIWLVAAAISLNHVQHELNEFYDTHMIRMARQMQVMLPSQSLDLHRAAPPLSGGDRGEADLDDLAMAVWRGDGRLVLVDREGAQLPYRPQSTGFIDLRIDGTGWRTYYLPAFDGRSLVAVGHALAERNEVAHDMVLHQMLPWLLMLPVLLLAMAWAAGHAMRPLDRLGTELARRGPTELQPIESDALPRELQPLTTAMNQLFLRIDHALQRERRFTGDAAHELRTPLAALRAQWDALRLHQPALEAEGRGIDAGLQRLERLLTQLLELARIDPLEAPAGMTAIDWPALATTVIGELLPLADRHGAEFELQQPPGPVLPLRGDPVLLGVLLRNLVDNALRASPAGATVVLRLTAHSIEVLDRGRGVPAAEVPRLGERFHRPAGSPPGGSGLGLSIARRVAELHGLAVRLEPRDGGGIIARIERRPLSTAP